MRNYLLVALGGALGSVARYWVSGFVAGQAADRGSVFPYGTLIANVTGSFVIGLFATLTASDARWMASSELRTFFMVGICGGYTTFSSFSLQTLNLVQDGDWGRAGVNVMSSVALCLLAVWLGHVLAASLNSYKGH